MKKILLSMIFFIAINTNLSAGTIETYKKACDSGLADGCFNLGNAYLSGQGVKQDYSKAIKLYTKACDGGFLAGCVTLGTLYAIGRGVKQDYSKAAKLLTKACDSGSQPGCKVLEEINKKMGSYANKQTKDLQVSKGNGIGFKGLYLQMPIDEACSNLAKKFEDKKFNKVKDGCYIGNGVFNSAEILSKHGKVTLIGILENDFVHGTSELFKVAEMDFKQFSREFVNHYDWIDDLEYELVKATTLNGSVMVPSYCNTDYDKKYKFCIDKYKRIELKYIGEKPSFD